MVFQRPVVLHIGSVVLEMRQIRAFEERGLNFRKVVLDDASKWFNDSRAIVIAEPPESMGLFRACVETLKAAAKDYGLSFVAIANSANHFRQIQKYWAELKIGVTERIYHLEDIGNAAEYIARYEPGPPVGDPTILTPGYHVSKRVKHLLRRAFYDCGKIQLEKLTGGKSSLNVYSVHAWLRVTEVGPRPLPFFIKIAEPKKILEELGNYDRYAEFYIPFHLRPNVVKQRCVSIRGLSAIVGNLVDQAVPLRRSLRAGDGVGAVFALFETSLKGFRFQPSALSDPPDMALMDFARDRIRSRQIKPHVIKCARRLGLSTHPRRLEEALCHAAQQLRCLTGPYHGDLHSANVLVRAADAILIDFSSTKHGPLTADPVALEVSLIFGTDQDDLPGSFSKWRSFVKEIYGPTGSTLRPHVLFEGRPNEFSWLRRALRELRHVLSCCDCHESEGKIVLATYLMRFARLGVEGLPNNRLRKLALKRHAYALIIAERIVKGLSKKRAPRGVS